VVYLGFQRRGRGAIGVEGGGFYSSIAKQSLQKQCKNYPKAHGQTEGGGAVTPSPPPEYPTGRDQSKKVFQSPLLPDS